MRTFLSRRGEGLGGGNWMLHSFTLSFFFAVKGSMKLTKQVEYEC